MKILIMFILCFWLLSADSFVNAGRFDKAMEKFNRQLDRSVQKVYEDRGLEVPTFEEMKEEDERREQEYDEWLQEQDDYDPELDDLYEDDNERR